MKRTTRAAPMANTGREGVGLVTVFTTAGRELAALASSGSPPTLRAQSSMASWRPTVLVATMSDQ